MAPELLPAFDLFVQFRHAPRLVQRQFAKILAPVLVRRDQLGITLDGLVEILLGRDQIVCPVIGQGAAVVGVRIFRIQFDRLRKIANRRIVLAAIGQRHAATDVVGWIGRIIQDRLGEAIRRTGRRTSFRLGLGNLLVDKLLVGCAQGAQRH